MSVIKEVWLMKSAKSIIIVLVIAIVGLGLGFGYRALFGDKKVDIKRKSDFAWGITVLNFPFPRYDKNFTSTQMKEVADLGAGWVRIEYEPKNPSATDHSVEQARKQNLDVVLIIPFGPNDVFKDKNLTENTKKYVTEIVNRYKGKVAVYQLATEVASVALQNDPSSHGIKIEDYPTKDLNAITTWVKTAAETVKALDPSAKRLVNDQWVHTGFFDHYFAQGGDFDILGWNWFSDMGTKIASPTLDQKTGETYALLDKLKSYAKPIWLTEVNRRLGIQGGNEAAAAQFIETMARSVRQDPAIKGFFVFSLLEDQAAPVKERGYSLIEAIDNDKEQKVTKRNAVYDKYQELINELN